MKRNRSSEKIEKSKLEQQRNLNFSKHLRKHLSPLAEVFKSTKIITNHAKNKRSNGVLTSTRYNSPTSYHSSEITSNKQSRQKNVHKKKHEGQQLRQIRKKNKEKVGNLRQKQAEKENVQKNLGSKLAQKYKIVKWKNKIRKDFIIKTRQELANLNNLHFLDKQIQVFSSQSSIRDPSKSFFGFLLSQNQQMLKKTTLIGIVRILVIDWMLLISASLLLNRETVHLSIHYLDSYFSSKQQSQQKIPIFAVAALLLAVKQQQREFQSILLDTACMSQKFNIIKDQVIQCQKAILTQLSFRLKSNTLAFWIDYFSLKWDSFVQSVEGQKAFQQTNFDTKIKLRSSNGDCYRLYRQMMELADVCLMFGDYVVFEKAKLSLACIYLVVRIQSQKMHIVKNQQDYTQDLFKAYYKLFQRRASPIFKDPYRLNEIFNTFLTETCEFQLTEIIPCIKYVANFLELNFNFNIDEKALDETKSYEDFIRRTSYSNEMKQYCLFKIS